MKMHLSVCVATLMFCGCATAPKALRQIQFDSDPPGARVFYGAGGNAALSEPQDYVGTTPCQWTPPQENGRFKPKGIAFYNMGYRPFVVFRSDWTNGASARRVFRCGAAFQAEDDMPSAIFFSPTNAPAKP